MKNPLNTLSVFFLAALASPLAGCFSDYSIDCSRNPALDCFWGGGGTGGGSGGTGGVTTTTPGPKCGDNTVDPGEVCDDGNTLDCDDCRADCSAKETGCGDGFLCPPEQCDEGSANSDAGTCTTMCKLPGCGDGVQQPPEECDDGNAIGGDNCSPSCTVECALGNYEGQIYYDMQAARCYLRVAKKKRAWTGAENECQLWYPTSHLVAFTDAAEKTAVATSLPGTTVAWTGGDDMAKLGTFTWTSGEPFPDDPTMWATGQPSQEMDQRCVAVDKNYLLTDEKCATLLDFICELDMTTLHVQ